MKTISIVTIVFIGIISFFFWKQEFQISSSPSKISESEMAMPIPVLEPARPEFVPAVIEKQQVIPMKVIIQDVPFISQAPTGNWKDSVFQNACEEASLLMADKWVRGGVFGTSKQVEMEIRKITTAEKKYFPKDSYDLSIQDILLLAQKYFPQMQVSLVKNVTTDDIKNALYEGNIVIIPANGQKLQNPNFTALGPMYHTLLIRGYDPHTGEFITNDPGTRKGNGYRYGADIIFDAMQDYETGYHGKRFPDEKVMLVVSK